LCEGVTLHFYLWVKDNGWVFLRGRQMWTNGIAELEHGILYRLYLSDCETTTYVTKNSKESKVL
jgi:hypothetical protein